ncbi:MAG: GH36 C-terminal domain-containing protein [Clostridia bacterium]|nr:GH36 C-terminal domain-containing protein [Clostridia bacterium]
MVFDGLDENTVYQLTFEDRPEQNFTATGADLMTKGIDVEIKYVGSEIIWITKAE